MLVYKPINEFDVPTINHGYVSCAHQLGQRTGAPPRNAPVALEQRMDPTIQHLNNQTCFYDPQDPR